MRLHIIGTGCPAPVADQFGSAFMLEMETDSVLVDCGPATTYKMARMGIDPGKVGHVFFTHHHFDHNVDFACFALCRWDMGKGTEPPLPVYGPPPTEAYVEKLLGPEGAFFVDWDSRVKHPASHDCHTQRGGELPRPAPAFDPHDVGPGKVAETDAWVATAELVHHVEPTMASLAFRFETDNGSVVFAGDCGDCKELRRFAKGADTLVLACTHFGSPPSTPAIVDVITGSPEVGEIAHEADVRRVVLTHMSPNYSNPGVKERAIKEVAGSFGGEILFPAELTTVDLAK